MTFASSLLLYPYAAMEFDAKDPDIAGTAGLPDTWISAAAQVAEARDADVLLYNADFRRPNDTFVIDLCQHRRRRPNVVVVVVSNGGDAAVAYRLARCLQRNYETVSAFITGWCKSAGTIFAIGAHELVISDHGELGPLDVQMQEKDELWGMSSGLTVMESLTALQERGFQMMESYFLQIVGRSAGQITFRTATEVASSLVAGLLSPVYGRLDPMHIGEAARAMQIARDYGQRLDEGSGNLRSPDALEQLVAGFSEHGFVIDRDEAAIYFHDVSRPSDELASLEEVLDDVGRVPLVDGSPLIRFLSNEREEELDDQQDNDRGPEELAAAPRGTVAEAPGRSDEHAERERGPALEAVSGLAAAGEDGN